MRSSSREIFWDIRYTSCDRGKFEKSLIRTLFSQEQSPLYDEEKKNDVNTIKFDLGNPLPTGKKVQTFRMSSHDATTV